MLGLKELILGPRTLWGSNVHREFLRVPEVLSFILSTALVLYFAVTLAQGSGFWSGVAFTLGIGGSMLLAPFVRSLARSHMVRARMWGWGREYFHTKQDMRRWISRTPGRELDRILAIPPMSWEPSESGGVVEYNTLSSESKD